MNTATTIERQERLTKAIYILQLLSFAVGITFLIAQVMNYIYRPEVRGTWLESHFIWTARTFWFGLLWIIVGGILHIILIGYVIVFFAGIWILYRIIRGLIQYSKRQAMYQTS